jgi:hypothetical protein
VAIGIELMGGLPPAYAIPSPDLAINMVSNAAQILGLVTASLGGLLIGGRRLTKGRKVVVQGVVKALPRTIKEEPKEEGHACPKPEWVVATQGLELR